MTTLVFGPKTAAACKAILASKCSDPDMIIGNWYYQTLTAIEMLSKMRHKSSCRLGGWRQPTDVTACSLFEITITLDLKTTLVPTAFTPTCESLTQVKQPANCMHGHVDRTVARLVIKRIASCCRSGFRKSIRLGAVSAGGQG